MSWLDLHMHTILATTAPIPGRIDGALRPKRRARCRCIGSQLHPRRRTRCAPCVLLGNRMHPRRGIDCTYQRDRPAPAGLLDRPGSPRLFPNGTGDSEAGNNLPGNSASNLPTRWAFSLMQSPSAGKKGGIVTGEMIAEAALVQDPENPPFSPPAGGARSDNPYVNIYWDFFSQGKPGYVPVAFQSLEGAVALVRSAGGLPVLAHPGNNIHEGTALLHGIVGARGARDRSVQQLPLPDRLLSMYNRRRCFP